MQNQPDLGELLQAVGRFLEQEVRPALKRQDPGLAFRTLIASNLCQLSAGELAFEEAQDQLELESLAQLYPDEPDVQAASGARRSQRRERLAALNRRLAGEIRGGVEDPPRARAIAAHLRETLKTRLMTLNPRFDSAADIP